MPKIQETFAESVTVTPQDEMSPAPPALKDWRRCCARGQPGLPKKCRGSGCAPDPDRIVQTVNVLPQELPSEGILDIPVPQIGEVTVDVLAPRVVQEILGFSKLVPQEHSSERLVKHTADVSVPVMCPFLQ